MKLVTVVMPVFNGEAHLGEAIESILRQRLTDFELLIIDDGSTDRSADVVQGYRDPRVRLLRNPTNLGIAASLNRGLDAAASVYVARMDADDVSLEARLEKQVAFLDGNPEVGVCGAWIEHFGSAKSGAWRPPTEHDGIRCQLLFNSALAHPTVVLRTEVLARHGLRYDVHHAHAEDYELWTRCAELTRLANVPEILLRYRMHPGGVTKSQPEAQRVTTSRIRRRQLADLGIAPSAAEEALHASIGGQQFRAEPGYLEEVERWLRRLAAQNRRYRRLPEEALGRTLARFWMNAGSFASMHGFWSGWRLFASPLTDALHLPPAKRARLLRHGLGSSLRARSPWAS